nr:hypothetical protein [Amycolatopsis regifaucium]
MASVLYDAVVVPCGPGATDILERDGYEVHFAAEAYKHGKPVAGFGSGLNLLRRAGMTAKRPTTPKP